ncbi:MAG: hypothetical protein ACI9E1_001240, partial [Cryomorphaceae bacterium]
RTSWKRFNMMCPNWFPLKNNMKNMKNNEK